MNYMSPVGLNVYFLFGKAGYTQSARAPGSRLCIKMGVRHVCTGGWDSGTRDEGLEDVEVEA